jgi:hypothetical protein
VKAGIGSSEAFVSCIVAGAAPEDRQTLVQLAASSLDHAGIDALARGTFKPNDQGGISATGLRFPDDNAGDIDA